MRGLLCLLASAVIASAVPAGAAPAPASDSAAEQRPATLGAGEAVILGLIEGITEFLPVSSTGHLIIATHALGLDSEQPLLHPDGSTIWYRPPGTDDPEGIPLTPKLAADTYSIVIQFGAIAAVAILYWRQMSSMIQGLLGRDPAGIRLLRNLIIAFVPAAVVGLLADDWIQANLFSVPAVIAALVLGAGLMAYAERRRKRLGSANAELDATGALWVGLFQCAALWPGTSRSMTTIVGGYFAGLEPRRAAEFSFLLGFVTLSAASVYSALRGGSEMLDVLGSGNVLLGAAVATVSAACAVRFLVAYLTRHGLAVFAVYRVALAAVLAVWLWF